MYLDLNPFVLTLVTPAVASSWSPLPTSGGIRSMKFEQVLQIYWTKGFLFGGKVLPFNVDWRRLGNQVQGFGMWNKLKLIRRFELHNLIADPRETFIQTDKEERKSINRIFSQMSSINYQINELTQLNVIRLFLIKSFRGKAQAFGKPSRGQRTWSNGWTAYTYNKDLRTFIATTQRQLNKDKKEEKINYKILKKKLKKPNSEVKQKKDVRKTSMWF